MRIPGAAGTATRRRWRASLREPPTKSLPARLRPLGDEQRPWTTFTRDISAGGLRVARQSAYREADVHEVVIGRVQGDGEITAQATAVRVTDKDVSLSFTVIEPGDRLLLAHLAFAFHRRRAARYQQSPDPPTADLRLDGAAPVASIGALVILPSRSRTKSRP